MIHDLGGVDAEECVGVKRRLRDLQELCRIKRWKVPGIVSEEVCLAAERDDYAAAATSPCAGPGS